MKKALTLTAIIGLLIQGCSTVEPLNIQYISYELINNRYDSDSYTNQYGIFFKYNGEQIPQRITQPLAIPLLGCKVEISDNGQQQTKYIEGQIYTGKPIDDQHTYLALMDFDYLNKERKRFVRGYIFEDKNFYVISDPSCRIIYSGNYEDYSTATITIPKQAITKPKATAE